MPARTADGVPRVVTSALPLVPGRGGEKGQGARLSLRACAPWAAALLYALVLAGLGARESLWGDEGFTAAMAGLPWATMWRDLAHIDVNMSLYYVLVGLVTRAFGDGEAAVRLVSALAIAGTIPVVVRLARTLLGERRGWIAGVVFAVNPFTAQLAGTARPYALLTFGCAVTTLLMFRALRAQRARDWAAWSVCGALLLYVHLLAVLVLAGQMLHALATLTRPWWRGRGVAPALRPSRAVVRVLASNLALPAAVLGVATIPTWAFLGPSDTLGWIPAPSFPAAGRVALSVLGGNLLAPLLGVALVAGVVRVVRRPEPGAELLLFLGAVPLVAITAMLPLQSLLIDEYFAPLLIPLSLLAAHGIAGLPRPGLPRVACAAVLLAGLGTVGRRVAAQRMFSAQDWRSATAALDRAAGPADAIGFPNAYYRIVAEYYGARKAHAGWLAGRPVLPSAPWGSLRPYQLDRIKRTGAQLQPARVSAEVRGLRSVWLVGPPGQVLDQAVRTLSGAGYEIGQTIDARGVQMLHLLAPSEHSASRAAAPEALGDLTAGSPTQVPRTP